MLQKVINDLSNYAGHTPEEFWERVSSDNIEDFLGDYKLPKEIYIINTDDYKMLKDLITKDVIKFDDKHGALLGQCEVNIVSNILILTHMYGSLVPTT